MWVATTKGFYSVVAHRFKDDTFIIRCRVKGDLLALEDYLPGVGKELYTDMAADYPYRADVPAGAWALAMARISTEIDYDNFKNAVADRQGKKRASIYMGVWSQLLKLEPRALSKRFQKHLWEDYDTTVNHYPAGRAPALRGLRGVTLFQNEFGMGVCVDCEVDAQKAKKAKKKTTTKRKKVKR